MSYETSRRCFLKSTSLALAGLALPSSARRGLGPVRSGEPLRIGVIGVANRGAGNLDGVSREDIVALCDIDRRFLDRAAQKHPSAKRFADFRELIELDGLQAVVISTADHTHAPAAAMALRRGLDVYCEKPLAHSVHEARALQRLAQEHGAVTQMGTQIHALPNYRRVVEHVQAGVIGPVREVHVFCGTKGWGGGARPEGEKPVPDWLDWDLWLGPAPARPYHDGYHPAHWRRFWDFGGGNLGDMGCHYMDLAFWALDLSVPATVEASGPPVDAETAPPQIVVDYHFEARGEQPPVAVTWHGGGLKPAMLADLGLSGWGNGVLFLGTEGRFLIGDYNKMKVGPEDRFRGFTPPEQTIADSIGHYQEWIEACRSRGPTTCSFAYSGRLTEAVLLGNVSYRLGGKKLEWDADGLRVVNAPEAAGFLRRAYRDGWEL